MKKNLKVQLVNISHENPELEICKAAWVSTGVEIDEERIIRVPNFTKWLWVKGHKSPFEHVVIQYIIECDIATHIHLIKHRMSSNNSQSARYKEIKEDDFIVPVDWELSEEVRPWAKVMELHTERSNRLYHEAVKDLVPILGRKRAKETARYFRPHNVLIKMIHSVNLSAFANFMYLRNSPDAQMEIREVAQQMEIELEKTGKFSNYLYIVKKKNDKMKELEEDLLLEEGL